MTFEEWWQLEDYRKKYSSSHPVSMAAAEAWEAATLAEREACAKVCENTDQEYEEFTGHARSLNHTCADAIRKRKDIP